MKFNKIFGTDLKVSELCLGTMTWGASKTLNQEAFDQMNYAIDQKYQFF